MGLTLETLSLRGGGIRPRGPCVSEAQMAGGGGALQKSSCPSVLPILMYIRLSVWTAFVLQRPLFRGKCPEDLENAARALVADILMMDI